VGGESWRANQNVRQILPQRHFSSLTFQTRTRHIPSCPGCTLQHDNLCKTCWGALKIRDTKRERYRGVISVLRGGRSSDACIYIYNTVTFTIQGLKLCIPIWARKLAFSTLQTCCASSLNVVPSSGALCENVFQKKKHAAL
jgi:hypothetical protein